MMLLPMLNGGSVAKEWQPMSALMCSGPVSRCSSFMAAKNGRSGQPVQSPEGRGGTSFASCAGGHQRRLARGGAGAPRRCSAGAHSREELADALAQHIDRVFAAHGQHALAEQRGPTHRAWRRIWLAACSMNSGWPSSTTSTARLPAQKRTHSSGTSG